MRHGGSVFIAAILMILVAAPTVSGSGYYKLYDRTFAIRENRLLDVSETVTLVNTSTNTRITSVTWTIPTTELTQVQVWDDVDNLNFSTTTIGSNAQIQITFRGQGIGPNSELTFHVAYTAGGLVSGTGVEYRAGLGGITAGDFRYENYIVRIKGPPGSHFFYSDPQAELVENDPPTVRYETSIAANDNFNGLSVRFYDQPAFYKVTLKYPFTNHGASSTTDLNLDAILFNNEIPWQFSALISSSHTRQTMWVDDENNWHGVFKINELTPGETETISLELLYQVQLYDPNISAWDVGSISEVPASLQGYLKQDDKWESESAALQQAAATAVGGETNVYLAAQAIENYVVAKLDYQVQDERRGALWAFTNNKGDCSEYTDLSIALARAKKIPARAMYGWGYYAAENLRGHAWLEYYFPGVGWLPADPTWDETIKAYFARLDPIHLTRNVRGLSSGESGANYTSYGTLPTLSDAEPTITVLTTAEAAQEFVNAAKYAVNLADKLLTTSPDETLQAKQTLAKQALAQAQDTSDENQKLLHAKNSLQNANEVISALGEKPTQQTISIDFEALLPYLIVVAVVIAVAGGAYAISRRRRKG